MKRLLMFGVIVFFIFTISSAVAAPRSVYDQVQTWQQAIANTDPLFADWTDGNVQLLLQESADSVRPAEVWSVEKNKKNLGYFVTSKDGLSLFEYSPITPVKMLSNNDRGSYHYAGPGMHLYRSEGQPDAWINLVNGDTLPAGKPVRLSIMENQPTAKQGSEFLTEPFVAFTTDTQADRGVAVMVQHSLGQSKPFQPKLLPKSGQEAGYLVFTGLEKDYYSVLAITGLQRIQGQRFLQVKDVFAKGQYPFYIRPDVPVNWFGSK